MRRHHVYNAAKSASLVLDVSLNNLTDGLIDQSLYAHALVNPSVTGHAIRATPNGEFVGFTESDGGVAKWHIQLQIIPMTIMYWVYHGGDTGGHGWFAEFLAKDESFAVGQALTIHGSHGFAPGNGIPGSGYMYTRIPKDTWTHIAVTYTSIGVTAYFNGVEQINSTIDVTNKQIALFGLRGTDSDNGNSPFLSAFRRLKIYKIAMDVGEITQIYKAEKF